ncbi:hypothetical protein EVA_20413 [gut metagenome]|uniref:Uncharacterized protein n=1 Tax=gut metagenome TaxID=749906 RepID=J9BV73_9ZZZZ
MSAITSINKLTLYVQYGKHRFICPESNVPSNIKELESLSAETNIGRTLNG